ncbi:Myb-like DNA-binding domain containing protein [Histomonas meleagridis]|uniref:Myb-like DNA-binding domain containing protein n=1 Tax=Histomonas meleagridis TaxID=135588 RepID=UPI00355A0341|nr:Myb-like DNA-binding domain containing protein [Histomonas meleagridis]KAH0799255.1 Myb-like DNA-binding domain containing protein [Histomonas meleagridis]
MSSKEKSALAPTRVRHKVSNKSKSTKWTQEEDETLLRMVSQTGNKNWNELCNYFPNKTSQQIAERWEKVVDPTLIKGNWTRQEDEIIIEFVKEHGKKNWTKLAEKLPGRIGKQCRERWRNHLDPDVNHEPWTEEEDEILIKMHDQLGNQWVKIAEQLHGRSDNAVKNRWNSTLKKKIEYQKSGTPRPRRGRPSRKNVPKSADDLPKPPKLMDVIPEIKETAQTPTALATPFFLLGSPFASITKSPYNIGIFSPTKDALQFSPRNTKDFEPFGMQSIGLFSPILNDRKEESCLESPLFKK